MLYMELFIDLLIAATIAIGLAYSCGLRCSIWTCSFTHHSYHCYSLRLFLWAEMLYMELFIYLSQLPLVLVWLILVD